MSASRRAQTIETPDGVASVPLDHGVVVTFPSSSLELDVDDWGRDVHTVRWASRIARLRWSPAIGGLEHLPAHGPALLVCNTRRFALSPLLVTWAIGRALDRPVRFVGRPEIAPVGPIMRQIGGLITDPAEVDTALAAGEVVVIGASPNRDTRRAGRVPERLLDGAWRRHVPVHPIGVLSSPLDRRVRIEIGLPVSTKRRRHGPLGPPELADATRSALQKVLDGTASPSMLV